MKLLLLVVMLCSTSVFGKTTEQTFFDQIKGKSIVGKSVEGVDTTFEFSTDGKSVMLKKNQGYKHMFVQMVGNIAVYEGMREKKKHYEAFKINNDQVMLTSNDQIGGAKLKSNTPQEIAKELDRKSLIFTFK